MIPHQPDLIDKVNIDMKQSNILFYFLIFYPLLSYASAPIINNQARFYPVKADAGMVVTQDYQASKVGMEILKKGGNAIDAAVAIGFAEAVTLPKAGNLGGGGFMLIYLADTQSVLAIDYREMAPSKANRALFLDKEGNVDHDKARYSLSSSGIPGTVAGLLYALEAYGSFKRKTVIQPAYHLAKKGFIVDQAFHEALEARKSILLKDKDFKKFYFKHDKAYPVGEKIRLPDLAKTLKYIIKEGKQAFYQGDIADKIVNFMQENDGLITHQDLLQYQVIEREPIQGWYRGYQVFSMPPPSSGGIHIIQALNMLEQYNMKTFQWGSAQHIHSMTEVFKRIYADRSQHLGDPDYYPVPVDQLTDKNYAKKRIKTISNTHATDSRQIYPGKLKELKESPQTTHYSVIDKWGNIVSNTYTLNFSFGSGKIVPGTGIILNNEMDDFSAKPGTANAYGLIGGEANAIQPNKRPLSSMSPTIIFKDKKPYLVTGSPGGSRIITSVINQIVNMIDFDMNVMESVSAPRFHHQWLPDTLWVESGFSPDTLSLLKNMGHNIRISRAYGSIQAIHINEQGVFFGAADPRRDSAKAMGLMKNGYQVVH